MEENQLFVQNALEVGGKLVTTAHTLAETTTSYLYLLMIFFSTALIISIIIVLLRNRKQKNVREYPLSNSEAPFVAIHLPIKDDLVGINCAKKCLVFDYPKNKYTIFIGDDSANPEISKQLRIFAAKHKQVKIYKRDSNRGYKQATSTTC